MRHLLRRFIPVIKYKPKKETAETRARRKQVEFAYAKWRTACSFGGLIFQVLGFLITIAMLSLLIYIHFIR